MTRNKQTHAAALLGIGLFCVQAAAQKPAADADETARRSMAVRPALMELEPEFKERIYYSPVDTAMPYRLFSPAGLEEGEKVPLVVYLHGAGGRGKDNRKQIHGGNVWGSRIWALPENQEDYPCFVLAPQATSWFDENAAVARMLIAEIVKRHPVDSDRIYVTGQSMGGNGTWRMLTTYPEVFAAGIPVCGPCDTTRAPILVQHGIPVWVFHGSEDQIVNVAYSRAMVRSIRRAGGSPLYTEYPGVKHNSWTGAYTEAELIPWLFSKHK